MRDNTAKMHIHITVQTTSSRPSTKILLCMRIPWHISGLEINVIFISFIVYPRRSSGNYRNCECNNVNK